MRIAISGTNRTKLVEKFEKEFKVTSVKPIDFNESYPIIDYAAESNKHWNDENVVFDGCVLDAVKETGDEAYDDILEQVCLDSLVHLDVVYVMYSKATDEQKRLYDSYISLFPDKIKVDTEA